MTLTPEFGTRAATLPPDRKRPAAPTDGRRAPIDDRPVEFWPTAAIRAALETDDLDGLAAHRRRHQT